MVDYTESRLAQLEERVSGLKELLQARWDAQQEALKLANERLKWFFGVVLALILAAVGWLKRG